MAQTSNSKKKLTAKERSQKAALAAKARAAATKQKVAAHPAAAKAKSVARKPASKLNGFMEFIREKGVVGLAIGLAIGTAATAVVAQIVGALISPTIALLVDAENLAAWKFTLSIGERSAVYPIGALIDSLIKFIAIAAVIYFVVLGLRLDKLDKKKED